MKKYILLEVRHSDSEIRTNVIGMSNNIDSLKEKAIEFAESVKYNNFDLNITDSDYEPVYILDFEQNEYISYRIETVDEEEKVVLNIYDEEYLMWTILVSVSRLDEFKYALLDKYNEFYEGDEQEIKYGGYYEYVNEWIESLDYVEVHELDKLLL